MKAVAQVDPAHSLAELDAQGSHPQCQVHRAATADITRSLV
jgi:hypothetical protein